MKARVRESGKDVRNRTGAAPEGSYLPPTAVGVVGCGTMGRIIVSALVRRGYPVVVHDPSPAAQTAATAAGASVASDLSGVGSCPVVILSLPGPREVRQAVLALLALPRCPGVIVDTTTSDPETTRELAAVTVQKGITFLDAPVLGRPASAGRWTLPVGGEPSAIDRVRPVLEAFAAHVIPVGPVGTAHTLKLLNQMMFAILNAATAEVLALAPHLGLSPTLFYETVVSSGAATVSGLFQELGRKISREDFSPVFSVELLCKDTDLALRMARRVGGAAVLTSTVQLLNHLARTRGLSDRDSSALVLVYRDLNSAAELS